MIYARSPFIVHVDDVGLEDIEFRLYVYNGTKDTDKGTADYTFAIDAVNGEVTFDVSPYIRELIGDRQPTSSALWPWVTMEIDKDTGAGLSGSFTPFRSTERASLGWTTPEDGVNYTSEPSILFSYQTGTSDTDQIIKPFEATGKLNIVKVEPYLGVSNFEIDFYAGPNRTGGVVSTVNTSATDSDENDDRYLVVDIPATAKSFEFGETSDVLFKTVRNIYEVGDCQNTPTRIDFLNKSGARDTVWFTGRTIESFNTSKSEYKKSILSGGTYSQWQRQKTRFNTMGMRRKRINSGMYPEAFNDLFRQLLFADSVWIFEDGSHRPITILSSDIEYKYGRYEKMISYEMEIEYANDALNTIK